MGPGRTVWRPPVRVSEGEVLRLLGIPRGSRPPRPALRRVLDAALAEAGALLQPAVVSATHPGLPGSVAHPPGAPVAFALCTVGAALDERVDALAEAGETATALVFDAIGSAAVEALADWTDARLCTLARAAGLHPGRRASPGYGGWPLAEQGLLFNLLEPEALGLRLNAAMAMTPRKSISFALPLTGGPDRPRQRCGTCDQVDCAYQNAPEVHP